MPLYMLDTNTVSQLLRREPGVSAQVQALAMDALSVSAVTEGELWFGLARRPDATSLHHGVREFLRRVNVLAWDSTAARRYGQLRATLEGAGKTLGGMDLMIAAHALAAEAVLVSNDTAFSRIDGLRLEDWTA